MSEAVSAAPARWRTLPVAICAQVVFLLIPVWYRLPEQPAIFTPYYATRFAIFIPLALTCALWVALGLPGIRRMASDVVRGSWGIVILALAIWMYGSAGWAFRRDVDPTLAVGTAVQFGVVAVFVVAVASVKLNPRWVVAALIFGLAWNAVLAAQQVALQESAGGIWTALGEFPIGVTQPRISVVQADGVRWLRPYGLLPHPNILAGFMLTALIACAAWLTDRSNRRWLPGGVVLVVGLWAFLLTFSRGAYLALAVGGFALLPMLRRSQRWNRQLTISIAVILITGIAFAAAYFPYVLARAEGGETTEQYSARERAELNEAAVIAIQESPLLGVGAGNLPWRSSYILAERGSIVQGNYPHHVWLTVWGELGLIGLGLFIAAVILGVEAGLRALRPNPPDAPYRAVLLAGFVALLAAGLFEYYPITMIQFQAGWWGILAVALAPADRISPEPVLESSVFAPEDP